MNPPVVATSRRRAHRPGCGNLTAAALARIRSSLGADVRSGLAGRAWTNGGESHWLVVPEVRAQVQSRPASGAPTGADAIALTPDERSLQDAQRVVRLCAAGLLPAVSRLLVFGGYPDRLKLQKFAGWIAVQKPFSADSFYQSPAGQLR